MEQYIDKNNLLAKIEKLKDDALQKKGQCKRNGLEKIMHQIGTYNKVLSLIDTLEVKESTDAFIEKACEWLRCNYLQYPSEDCADTTKFVTDFKKYMKRE